MYYYHADVAVDLLFVYLLLSFVHKREIASRLRIIKKRYPFLFTYLFPNMKAGLA